MLIFRTTHKECAITFCRYFKGEKENPYKVSAAWYIWATEKDWVDEILLDNIVTDKQSLERNHYLEMGLADFEKFDDTPITLKSKLFALLEKWNEGIVSKDDFAQFYTKWKEHEI